MACGRTGRLGNGSFKKETAYGTYVAPDLLLRLSSESINRTIAHTEDEAIVGEIYTTEMILTSDGASGSIDTSLHGDTAGVLLQGVLGGESAVSDPFNSVIAVSYNGVSPYARLSLVGTDLLAELSADGSIWAADTNFNTTGTIDISSAPFDTFAELSTAIATYTGWEANLFGLTTATSTNIPVFAVTNVKAAGIQQGAKLLTACVSASTLAKTHNLTPAAVGTCLPSYTFQFNRVLGTNKSVAFTGSKISSVGITLTAKELAKASISVMAQKEVVDQTDVSLAVPNVQAFTAQKTKILHVRNDGTQLIMDEVKDLSLTINSNLDENGAIGSLYNLEPVRQKSTIDLSYTANNTSTQYAVRDNYINDQTVETIIWLESNTEIDSTNDIPYSILFRIPSVKFTDFNSPLSTADRLTISASGIAEKPKSTVNSNHIYVYVNDADVTTY